MKKRFRKVFYIICLAVLLVLGCHNFCYAGFDSDSASDLWWAVVAAFVGPLILIICLALFAALRDSSLEQQKNFDIKTKGENIEKNYSIGEVILYAIVICIIIYLMLFNKNILLAMNVITAISLILMAMFLHILYIEKKQEKLEQYGKTRTVSKDKVEKSITKIRNNVHIAILMVTCLEIFENVGPILILLLIFITTSIVMVMLTNKKLATIIGFIVLISSILLVK